MKIYFLNDGCGQQEDFFRQIAECAKEKYIPTKVISEADVIVHFTCGFVMNKVSVRIGLMNSLTLAHKTKKENAITIITGCGVKMYKPEIFEEMKNTFVVDLPDFVKEVCKILNVPLKKGAYYLKDSPHKLMLNIARGCPKRGGFCRFCKFNYLRIPFKSLLTIEEVVEIVSKYEIRILNLTAPNTTSYGLDFGDHKPKLHLLIQAVSKIPTLKWIAVTSVASSGIYPELLNEISQNKKVYLINYYFQSGSQRMLNIMNIGASIETHKKVIRACKAGNVIIETGFLMSHPGENNEDLQKTLGFIKENNMWDANILAYINSDSTPSSEMKPLSDFEFWRHYNLVYDKVSKLRHEFLDNLVGTKIQGFIIDIDEKVYIQCLGINACAYCEVINKEYEIADEVTIEVTDVKDYDSRLLEGNIVE